MGWTIKQNLFEGMAERLETGIEIVVDQTANNVAETARRLAPEKSGRLKASIYAQTRKGDGYAGAVSRVTSHTSQGDLDPFEESGISTDKVFARTPAPIRAKGHAEARVLVAVTYGVYVHQGYFAKKKKGQGKWVAGRPFLKQARDEAERAFILALTHELKSLSSSHQHAKLKAPRGPSYDMNPLKLNEAILEQFQGSSSGAEAYGLWHSANRERAMVSSSGVRIVNTRAVYGDWKQFENKEQRAERLENAVRTMQDIFDHWFMSAER